MTRCLWIFGCRCRMSYRLRESSPDVAIDDVKYDVSNYARPPAMSTFWLTTSRPPCQHWPPPCHRSLCLAASTTTPAMPVCSSSGYRSSRLYRSDPHIILSAVSAAESLQSGRHYRDALDDDDRRRDSADDQSSSPQSHSRSLLHSMSAQATCSVAAVN